MMYDSFFKKIVRLIVLSLFSGIVMPMARVPVAQYVPSPAQFGGGQAVDKPVLTNNFVSEMSPETVAFMQQELSKGPRQVWTDQKLQKPRMSSSAGMFRSSMPRLMSRQEAYKFLNLTEQATPTEIKGTYRRLAKKYHPDVAGAQSTEKMQTLQQAYEILTNKAVPDSSNQSSGWQYTDFYRQADQDRDYRTRKGIDAALDFAVLANDFVKVDLLLQQGARPTADLFKQMAWQILRPYQSRAKMVEKLCRAGVVPDDSNFRCALGHVSPEIIEGFVKSGLTIPLDAWKNSVSYQLSSRISNRMIPLLLEYDALEGLTASDVRAWYKLEKEFLDRLIPGQPEPKYASLEGEKRSSKVDAQNAIKAMETWFAKRNESPEESLLQKAWRKMSGK